MKILIWAEVKNNNSYDIFRQLDYLNVYNEIKKERIGIINVGNKVWIQGIVSELSTKDNEIFFLNKDESWDEINSKYDKIVYSAANMFCSSYNSLIDEVTKIFKNSKIPIYVIAIGAQANNYDCLDELVNSTKVAVSKFVEAIYNSGGEIACRGHFTKEYLDRIIKNSAEVTGCPSLYQNGRDLKININNIDYIKPIFNGQLNYVKLLNEYKNSVYIDQDEYLTTLYNMEIDNPQKILGYLITKYGYKITKLLIDNRIKAFYDIGDWKNYIETNNYNFTIGTRIHGNIMSLLSGIPSVIIPCDSRTREMAEFYHIPIVDNINGFINIEKIYSSVDFDDFNKNYVKIYDNYNCFLKKHKLVNEINENNKFWNKGLPINNDALDNRNSKLKEAYLKLSIKEKLYYYYKFLFKKSSINSYEIDQVIEKYDGLNLGVMNDE